MLFSRFIPLTTKKKLVAGQFSSRAPSNIALIKYWGKYGIQLPKNASLSFSLSQCSTQTTLAYTPHQHSTIDFEVFFEKRSAPEFKPKIETFFKRVLPYAPYLKDYHFTIHTTNTFPHSSGIASSASGMAALSLCVLQMEKALYPEMTTDYFYKKASFLARLGSGSAARSISGPVMIWGKHPRIKGSCEELAIANPFQMHPFFENYQDTILIVDKGQKKVSSTLGHDLMNNHPFAQRRFEQAAVNILELIHFLTTGDAEGFIELVESEALTLHAMMMTSRPYYLLMKPQTLQIIEAIWDYRQTTGQSLCFTLDAGANVHLLYPKSERKKTMAFIKDHLSTYCQHGAYICDQVGKGAVLL